MSLSEETLLLASRYPKGRLTHVPDGGSRGTQVPSDYFCSVIDLFVPDLMQCILRHRRSLMRIILKSPHVCPMSQFVLTRRQWT